MAENLFGAFERPASTVFFLIEPRSDPSTVSKEFLAEIDDVEGIQAYLNTEEVDQSADVNWYDLLLSEAKVGSRWGKELLAFYRDFLEELSTEIEESDNPVQHVAAKFSQYDADAFDSGVLGEELSLGIGVANELETLLQEWGSTDHTFSLADLRAAVGYVADRRDLDHDSGIGYLLFEFMEPISEIDRQTTIDLSRVFQELQFSNLNVAVIMPDEQGAEEQIRDRFKSLGKFFFETIGEEAVKEAEVKEIAAWIDSWYDDLCYEVEGSQIRGEVAAKAGAVAAQLRESEKGMLFADAITHGLLYEYSKAKLEQRYKDDFDELWADRIIQKERYTQYGSERQSFPRVTVARTDGRKHTFELRVGPNGRISLNGIPIPDDNPPHKALIETIERFLQADQVSEERWQKLTDQLKKVFPSESEEHIRGILSSGLLSEARLPPEGYQLPKPPEPQSVGERDKEWFQNHWRAILSTYKLSTVRGSSIIKQKFELRDQMSIQSPADAVLYQKLERDLTQAEEYFREEIESRVLDIIPDDLESSVVSEIEDMFEFTFSVTTGEGESDSCTVRIEEPYQNVFVAGQQITRPIISNVVQEIVKHLDHTWYFDASATPFDSVDRPQVLYNLFCLYTKIIDAVTGELIYFEEFVQFCSRLSHMGNWIRVAGPSRPIEEIFFNALSDEAFVNRLRDQGVNFHRKGNDPRTPIEVGSGNKYIAIELDKPLEWDYGEL